MDGFFLTAFLFFLGLFFGSFLNVVADRLWNGESIVTGRSHCDHCKNLLTWYELLPVVSFLMQGGKCRHCHAPMSIWYPFSELLTGLVFAGVALTVTSLIALILTLLLVCCLLIIFFADWKYSIVPFPVIVFAVVISFILLSTISPAAISGHVLAGLGGGGFFLLIFLLTKGGGMGFGDVLYAFLMGLLLGFPEIVVGLYLAFLTGAIVSLVLVLLHKKKLHGDTIPFGPFLVFGTLVLLFWGEQCMELFHLYFP